MEHFITIPYLCHNLLRKFVMLVSLKVKQIVTYTYVALVFKKSRRVNFPPPPFLYRILSSEMGFSPPLWDPPLLPPPQLIPKAKKGRTFPKC